MSPQDMIEIQTLMTQASELSERVLELEEAIKEHAKNTHVVLVRDVDRVLYRVCGGIE